ncbi:hypothetical protein [Flagellimonas nanhaiensis]|uniref:Uncharacterized protein n=1 Tax=Flagellimonas nanhaiensis TaxID=2292706 RepID=A0A371JNT9_9FLAO|nr:hypothetical protein [Allomuricauda nanhaiensis]RDY58897.1 hypothetical protein DX873_14660 [Allomuricauda nanhaiensis]
MSKQNFIHRIRTSIKDQGEGETIKSPFGTFLVLFSGIVLYADKIVDYWNIPITYEFQYYNNAEVFIWVCSATVSPLLLIAGYWFRPKSWALASPLAAYSVQMMYIWRDEKWIQRDYFWHHTIAFMIGFLLLILLIKWATSRKSKSFYIKTIRSFVSFVMEETEQKDYIKKEKKKEYNKRTVELVDKAVGNE